MKVSELTVDDIARHMKLDTEELTEEERTDLQIILDAAIEYISDYTGIPIKSETGMSVDDYLELEFSVREADAAEIKLLEEILASRN